MTEIPETHYAKTADGAHIAYQVLGEGPPDVVFIATWGSNLEVAWELPVFARFFRRLASFSRLIRFDMRGSGLSDPLGMSEQPTLEARATEMLAVLDAAGCSQGALVANQVTGLFAIFFAASHPQRTSALVLDGCYARLAEAPDYPWGVPAEQLDRAVTRVATARVEGGVDLDALNNLAPTARLDREFAQDWARYVRSIYGPGMASAAAHMMVFGDVRPLLSTIQVPTRVLYRSEDRFAGKPHAPYLAEHIPGARLMELPGQENLIFVGDTDAVIGEIQEFLTGVRSGPTSDRVLSTVLFTDIVGSTDHAAALGDQRWRELLDRHDRAVRRQLERFRGREVNTAGDGFIATFDGPGRAIECACAIRDVVEALDIQVRIGLHTGEIELRGDDVAGLTVHIGARIASEAKAGEVLVSSTVKDLVVGSGIEFEDRGEHELKGVPGSWKLFGVTS